MKKKTLWRRRLRESGVGPRKKLPRYELCRGLVVAAKTKMRVRREVEKSKFAARREREY